MVGWSRRNTESKRRKDQWFASLSEDEKEAYLTAEAERERRHLRYVILVSLLVMTTCFSYLMYVRFLQ